MTCVAGVIDGGRVLIGADSAGSNASHQLSIRKDRKVFHNGPFLIGGTGPFRLMQILRYTLDLPECGPGEDVERYMATKFVQAVRTCLTYNGYAWKSSERESFEGQFLVGYQGRLFCVEGDYQVEETVYGYNAVGSGADLALGALYATQIPYMEPQRRLELALKAAEQHNTTVRYPFHIGQIPAPITTIPNLTGQPIDI